MTEEQMRALIEAGYKLSHTPAKGDVFIAYKTNRPAMSFLITEAEHYAVDIKFSGSNATVVGFWERATLDDLIAEMLHLSTTEWKRI